MYSSNKKWLSKNLFTKKVIVFDFDNTIVDESYSIKHRWDKVLSKYEKKLNSKSLKKIFFNIYNSKGSTYKYHVDDALKQLGLDNKFKIEIVNDFLNQKSETECLFPYSKKLINLLYINNFQLAIFTNGIKEIQEHRIEISYIKKYFSYIQYGDCYSKKPHKDGFVNLCNNLEVNSSEIMMIGDSYDEDFIGARSIDASCILLNCNKKYKGDFLFYTNIESLYQDLIDILEK